MADKPENMNEITSAVHDTKRAKSGAQGTAEPGRKRRWPAASIGLGIGSAALAAAAIYARKSRSKD